jgi:hypothetical protein
MRGRRGRAVRRGPVRSGTIRCGAVWRGAVRRRPALAGAVRARVRSPIDKLGVDFAPIDNILVDPAEFDAALVDRDRAPSPDDRARTREEALLARNERSALIRETSTRRPLQ